MCFPKQEPQLQLATSTFTVTLNKYSKYNILSCWFVCFCLVFFGLVLVFFLCKVPLEKSLYPGCINTNNVNNEYKFNSLEDNYTLLAPTVQKPTCNNNYY